MTGHNPLMLSRLHTVKSILESASLLVDNSIRDSNIDIGQTMLITLIEDALFILKRGEAPLLSNVQ